MVINLGGLLGSGLHIFDAHGEADERAGLLAVGGRRSLSRLGEENEVQSRAFGLVSWRWILISISDQVLLYMIEHGIGLTSWRTPGASRLREKGFGARGMLAALCVGGCCGIEIEVEDLWKVAGTTSSKCLCTGEEVFDCRRACGWGEARDSRCRL